MVKTENEIYDVSKYSDNELFTLLDLTGNPTDRELEAKILFLIKKYDTIKNESGYRLATFFRDIFDHFFESDEDGDEYSDNIQIIERYTDLDTVFANIIQGNVIVSNNQDGGNVINIGSEITGNIPVQQAVNDSNFGNIISNLQSIPENQNNIGLVQALDYSKDSLNPLLKQTVKRIISIDSQYREDYNSLSTEFTFNLSDPLRDVVSLKLYSIQIPYTWWTINANYGSNLIYLKGNSPGINTGNFDLLIEITAGNYSPDNLVTTINNSLSTSLLSQPDVSFGRTGIIYNPNTSLCTFNIDIKKAYNESNYYLYFPVWSTPNQINHTSIPSFLGYNYPTYYPFSLTSSPTLDLTTSSLAITDDTNATYYLDQSNNYFTIITYVGPGEYSAATSIIDTSYQITLSTPIPPGGGSLVTRSQIVADLSNQLANNVNLQGSSITRIDITDTNNTSVGYSFFSLKIKLNRNTTNPTYNIKNVVIFQNESYITQNTTHNAVWSGITSCFRFMNLINQPNDIVSESQPVSEAPARLNYSLPLQIYLKCWNPMFNNPLNDYNIIIPTNAQGYTYSDFINQINTSIAQVNVNTQSSRNKTGDFNMANSYAYIDISSQFNLKLDINKTYNQDMYTVDLSQSYLHLIMGFNSNYLDLSSTNVFSSSFPISSYYQLVGTNLLLVNPVDYGGNAGETPYEIPLPNTINSYTDKFGIYNSYQSLQNAINQQFSVFTNNTERTMQGTNVSLTYNNTTKMIDCSFTIVIQRVLTDKDYSIQLIDPSAVFMNETIIPQKSIWYENLLFDSIYLNTSQTAFSSDTTNPYKLVNAIQSGTSYSLITSLPITFNSIVISNVNNYFYLKPLDNGVTDINNSNDIRIQIPNGVYKRSDLLTVINNALNYSTSALTYGSLVSIININSVEYTNFHVIINKVYTAADYNLVFYDPYSFVKCFSGINSVRNTTWDSTLGWTLGFRNSTIYNLSNSPYIKTDSNNVVTIIGDTTVSTNLYNYFLICIDDFNLNHLNDGLVTVTSKDTNVALPSYANRTNYTCDPITGLLVYNNTMDVTTFNSLTQQQVYSLTQIANNQRSSGGTGNITKSISSGPFVKDVFGIIPMKTSGLANGSVYVDFSGTLQNQERTYFGPVNIHRMSVKLVTDRGDVVDLNGSNWSFSLLCEQLYQQKPGNSNAKNAPPTIASAVENTNLNPTTTPAPASASGP